tara:strand:+ start:140 stop:376 length:237 start_codon:yes stop_codon:yes gene_type:complete
MGWVSVTVTVGKEEIEAMFNGIQVDVPGDAKIGESLKVDGVDYKVINTIQDNRDPVTHVILANAKDKGEKSDDESVKG